LLKDEVHQILISSGNNLGRLVHDKYLRGADRKDATSDHLQYKIGCAYNHMRFFSEDSHIIIGVDISSAGIASDLRMHSIPEKDFGFFPSGLPLEQMIV